MATYRYRVKINADLANGEVVSRWVNVAVEASSRTIADLHVEGVAKEKVMDWGGDEVDAPVESVEILRVGDAD